jgi:hypothetical protein
MAKTSRNTSFKPTPTGATSSCSTNTFTATNGAGLGASHQTGWTGLVAKLIQLFGLLDAQQTLEVGKTSAFRIR